jgi:6-phosphogluconolactonase (cycloisomerase 2 family)
MADTGKTGGVEGASMNGKAKGWGWRARTALANVLRVVPFFVTMAMMVILWDACGGGLFPKVSSSSSATSTSTKTPGLGNFLYVTENATGFISEYSRNPTTGALSRFGQIAAGDPNGPVGIGTSSGLSLFVYAVNSSTASDNVFQYSLSDVSGALTALSPASVSAGIQPQWITLTPNGEFAYVTNFGSSSISQYTVNSSTGVLTLNSPSGITIASSAPSGEAATNSFLYVSDQGNEDVVSFPIDSTTGTLGVGTAVSLGEVGAAPGPMIVDASNSYVYATDTTLGLVYALLIDNSGFSLINGYSSANPGTNASVGLASVITTVNSVSQEFLYVANEASNSITIFQVLSGGLLNALSSFTDSHLQSPTGLVATTDSASGNSYLYVTNQRLGVGNICVYTINGTSGALAFKSSVNTSSVNSQPMFPLIAF